MAILKSQKDIAAAREAGRRLAAVLKEVIETVQPGTTPQDLDTLAERLIRDKGDKPAFLHYTPGGARKPYPATLCVSVNDQVVHAIPNANPFKVGDIVSIDIGLAHEGIFSDMARTVGVGETSEDARKLIAATEEALRSGIRAARVGSTTGDIGFAVESCARERGFSVVLELGGHGVGRSLHEAPFISNFGRKGEGVRLEEGMLIAIEPIFNVGKGTIKQNRDGYTISTRDGSLSAHFEDTILITDKGPEVLTSKNVDRI